MINSPTAVISPMAGKIINSPMTNISPAAGSIVNSPMAGKMVNSPTTNISPSAHKMVNSPTITVSPANSKAVNSPTTIVSPSNSKLVNSPTIVNSPMGNHYVNKTITNVNKSTTYVHKTNTVDSYNTKTTDSYNTSSVANNNGINITAIPIIISTTAAPTQTVVEDTPQVYYAPRRHRSCRPTSQGGPLTCYSNNKHGGNTALASDKPKGQPTPASTTQPVRQKTSPLARRTAPHDAGDAFAGCGVGHQVHFPLLVFAEGHGR